ncbi:MAG TPA: hypothetical protein VLR90_23800 [Blastocatellia bacterium]|nr:hypothetical protein [Blastocatellia bacterium]
MQSMIAFRALQGLGAGGLLPLSQAAIADLFSPRERGRYHRQADAVQDGRVSAGAYSRRSNRAGDDQRR